MTLFSHSDRFQQSELTLFRSSLITDTRQIWKFLYINGNYFKVYLIIFITHFFKGVFEFLYKRTYVACWWLKWCRPRNWCLNWTPNSPEMLSRQRRIIIGSGEDDIMGIRCRDNQYLNPLADQLIPWFPLAIQFRIPQFHELWHPILRSTSFHPLFNYCNK